MRNRLKRLEDTIPPPAKDSSRAREVLDRLPLEAKRLIVEAFRKKREELGLGFTPRPGQSLTWTDEEKKQLQEALTNAIKQGDRPPQAPPPAEKPAPAKAAEPAAPGPEQPAHPPVAEAIPVVPNEPSPQAVPPAQTVREPIRIAFPKDPSSKWVFGVPERLWRRLRL
jgi:hypothetical protein